MRVVATRYAVCCCVWSQGRVRDDRRLYCIKIGKMHTGHFPPLALSPCLYMVLRFYTIIELVLDHTCHRGLAIES